MSFQPKHKTYVVIALFLFLSTIKSEAQDNLGFNFVFMTWHLGGDEMAFLQPNRLIEDATLVPNWGGVIHYERFIYKRRLSLKVAQGAYSDCARLFAGHTHLAFRLNLLNGKKHDLRLGFGPTWVYRESWERFPGYVQNNPYLKSKGDWQHAFVWYGGSVEYDYRINDRFSANFHAIPGLPDFFTFGIGFRYWPTPIPPNRFWKENPKNKKWFYNAKKLKAQ